MTALALLRDIASGRPGPFPRITVEAPIDTLADVGLVRVTRDSRGRPVAATITEAGKAVLGRAF
jgi:hypothetical protein